MSVASINLSRLPAPDVVEALSFEQILKELKDALIARDPKLAEVLALESEPLTLILEVVAYREVLVRQRVNDAGRAVMLPSAQGGDLDNLGALYGLTRAVVIPAIDHAIPPRAAVMETDTAFRRRIALAPEGLSTAGSEASYVFHALSAGQSPTRMEVSMGADKNTLTLTYHYSEYPSGGGIAGKIKDASAVSPAATKVTVTVLEAAGDGSVDTETLAAVRAHLTGAAVRPLTDQVTVQGATINRYAVTATLFLYDGPDADVVKAAAEASLRAFAEERHRLGATVTESGIHAALQVAGVQKVVLTGWSDIASAPAKAPYCNAITLTTEAA